jgi:predicted nuclease of predicted toxin-antitoxin system
LKLKLDENLGKSVATILENAGHNVETITGEGLRGAKDKEVIAACKTEGRCLVTLDCSRYESRHQGLLRMGPAIAMS